MANIALLGLESAAAADLIRILEALGHQAWVTPTTGDAAAKDTADLILCSAGADGIGSIGLLRALRPEVPVISIGRQFDAGEWVDSLEAGAADYLYSPFDLALVSWILHSVLPAYTPLPSNVLAADETSLAFRLGPVVLH